MLFDFFLVRMMLMLETLGKLYPDQILNLLYLLLTFALFQGIGQI